MWIPEFINFGWKSSLLFRYNLIAKPKASKTEVNGYWKQ